MIPSFVLFDLHQSVTSIRQAAEWGIQGTFARTSLRLPSCSASRHGMLEVVFRLYNARTRMMNINQTRVVYSPDYFPNMFARNQHTRLCRYYNIDADY